MNILITGASGFIAKNLIINLINFNYKIYICSRNLNRITYFPKIVSKREIIWSKKNNFKSILDKINIVIHTMSPDHNKGKVEFSRFYEINKLFIDTIKKKNNITLIYLSSVQVYGPYLQGIINENNSLIPFNNYSKFKILTEQYIQNGLNKYIILRLSNVYGEPSKNSNINKLFINDLIKKAIENKKFLKINSNANTKRDFISSKVVATSIHQIIKKKQFLNQSIFNLTSSKTYTLLEFAEVIKKRLNKYFKKPFNIIYKKNDIVNDFTITNKKIISKGIKLKKNHYSEIDKIIVFYKINL